MSGTATVTWDAGASVREQANTGGVKVSTLLLGDTFKYSEIVPDSNDPTNPDKAWALISEGEWAGKYTAVKYPSSSGVVERCSLEEDVPVPAPTAAFPSSFILKSNDPNFPDLQAEYKFVKIIQA